MGRGDRRPPLARNFSVRSDGGRIPTSIALWDVVAFLVLLVGLRWLRVGTALSIVVVLLIILIDPDGRGLAIYIAMCGVVAAVRAGRFEVAVPTTAIYAGVMFGVSFRKSEYAELLGAMFSTAIVCLVVWVIGLGFREVGRLERQRAMRTIRQRQLAVAADIHDFVGHHLTNLVLQAELARGRNELDLELLDRLAERARLANRALREVTSTLHGEAGAAPSVGIGKALRRGIGDLKAAGFLVRLTNHDEEESWSGIGGEVDLAAGRIIYEALHNASKHGEAPGPVVVVVEKTDSSLDFMVSNPYAETSGERAPGVGLEMIRQHAEVVGGTASFTNSGGTWACAASLPILLGQEPT